MSLDRFEQALLRSGNGDGPTRARRDAARSAVLRAAGISVAAAAGGGAAVKTFGVAKVLLLGLLSAGAVTVMVVAARPARPGPTTPIGPTVAMTAPVPAPARTVVPTSVSVDELPSATAEPAASGANANAKDPLAVEAALLETARACLAAGDRGCARARLVEHHARFARGTLADEASVLAIDTALAEGDRAEARRIARSMLARQPNGAWSARVKKLAEETAEDQPR